MAADIEKKIIGGGYLINDHTVEDLLQRYLSAVSIKKRGADKEKIRIMRLCRDPVAQLKLSELQPSYMAEWRDRLLETVTEATVQRYWNLFSHAFNVAVNEWQWLSENPLKKVARPKSTPPRDRRISQDEIDRLLFALGYDGSVYPETVTSRVGAALLFAIETAMRAGEIVSLTWANIDTQKRKTDFLETFRYPLKRLEYWIRSSRKPNPYLIYGQIRLMHYLEKPRNAP